MTNYPNIDTSDKARASLFASISAADLSLRIYNNETPKDGGVDAYEKMPTGEGEYPVFILTIEAEQILCFSRDGQNITAYEENIHALGILEEDENGRGFNGSTATTHNADSIISCNVVSYITKSIFERITADENNLRNNFYTSAEIDAILQGKNTKDPVIAATIENISLSGEQIVDGVELVSGNRVLVKNQSNATENGIYIVSVETWDRASDMNDGSEFNSALVPVREGQTNADSLYLQSVDNPIVGTDEIIFSQIGASLEKASEEEVITGTNDTKYITPLKNKTLLDDLKLMNYFGDGSDGDVVIEEDTTLERDMFYKNLTVNSGATLNTGGYKIFVLGRITNNGTIERNGVDGGDGGNGMYGTLGTGGIHGHLTGLGGSSGANGGNGGNTGVGFPGGSIPDINNCFTTGSGGNGGRGSFSSYNGGDGGTVGICNEGNFVMSSIGSVSVKSSNDYYAIVQLLNSSFNSNYYSGYGGAGGGGGSLGTSSRCGGGGGGGGSAGGIVYIQANEINNQGLIEVKGGNGGNGGNGATDRASGAGGGGGGGKGGRVVFIYRTLMSEGNFDYSGGIGGAPGTDISTGTPAYGGSAGSVGGVTRIKIKI